MNALNAAWLRIALVVGAIVPPRSVRRVRVGAQVDDESAVREAVAKWVVSNNELSYSLIASFFMDTNVPRTPRGLDFVTYPHAETVRAEGTLLSSDHEVLLFRCHAATSPFTSDYLNSWIPANDRPRIAAELDGIPSSYGENLIAGPADRDDLVFYKRRDQALLLARNQEWIEMTRNQILGVVTGADGQLGTIKAPSPALRALGLDDLAILNCTALLRVVSVDDPRRTLQQCDLSKAHFESTPNSDPGIAYLLRVPLPIGAIRSCSGSLYTAEISAKEQAEDAQRPSLIPDMKPMVSDVRADGEIIIGVTALRQVQMIQMTTRVSSAGDASGPSHRDAWEEVYHFTPLSSRIATDVSRSIKDRLGVPQPSPTDVTRWAEVVKATPTPDDIPSEEARARIAAVGLPWLVREKTSGMELVLVPPGEFMMGSDRSHDDPLDDAQAHRVRIASAYYIGRYEVTQEEYLAVTGKNPSIDIGSPRLPVNAVSLADIGATDGFLTRTGLRLPTEAEWEYAARGLTGGSYPWGDAPPESDFANFAVIKKMGNWEIGVENKDGDPIAGASTRRVGSFPKGVSWCGAFDMAGNVSEWCADTYDALYYRKCGDRGVVADPCGPVGSDGLSPHVIRGGSHQDLAAGIVSTRRNRNSIANRNPNYGFRCAKTP